jgi:hypothetical protein
MQVLERRLEELTSRLTTTEWSNNVESASADAFQSHFTPEEFSFDEDVGNAGGIEANPSPELDDPDAEAQDSGQDEPMNDLQPVSSPAIEPMPNLEESRRSWESFTAFPRPQLYHATPLLTMKERVIDHYSAISSRRQNPALLLEHYRIYIQPNFPFVVVPDALGSTEGRRSWPFLWRAVELAVLWLDEASIEIGDQLLQDIMLASVKQVREPTDLVQGLLVFIAWYVLSYHQALPEVAKH